MEYYIVSEYSKQLHTAVNLCEQKVTQKLEEGYILQGGISVSAINCSVHRTDVEYLASQALVKT